MERIRWSFRKSIFAAVLAAFGAGLYWTLAPRPAAVETAVVRKGRFEERLTADGRLRARAHHAVAAFADGELRRVTLKVGDAVKKGDPVARLFWPGEKIHRAPASGVVSRVFREGAGPVRRGEPLLEIADISDLEVAADLLTTDAARVRPGLPMTVTGWGGEPLAAEVRRVSRAGFTKVSALGVEEERTEVVGALEGVPTGVFSRLGDNFHVDITFTLSVHDDVLVVPLGALFKEGDRWALYRVVGERARKTFVEAPLRGETEAVVSEGLSAGDTVILYPGDRVRPGVRVVRRR